MIDTQSRANKDNSKFVIYSLLEISTEESPLLSFILLPALVAEHIHKATVYLSNIQYDSIYIYKDKLTDRSRDTLYIKELHTEYRYKYLRDTDRIVQHDSIPYEVIVYKDPPSINHKPSTINLLSYLSFGILLGILVWRFLTIIRKFL